MEYALSIFLSLAMVASAFQPVVVGDVWEVAQADAEGNCTMSAVDKNGTKIMFVRFRSGEAGVIFENQNWASLSKSHERNLRVGIASYPYSYYKVKVGYRRVATVFTPNKLSEIFTGSQTVALRDGQKALSIIHPGNLESAALRELDRCAGYANDPFAR